MQSARFYLSVILILVACIGLILETGKAHAQVVQGDTSAIVDETPSPTQLDEKELKAKSETEIEENGGAQEPTSWGFEQQSYSVKTPYEVYLSGATIILAICMAVLLCAMAAIGKLTEMFIQSFIVIMAIFAALFLMVAGYDEKQVAPVFGILGSVLGYVFGRAQANRGDANSTSPPVQSSQAAENTSGG